MDQNPLKPRRTRAEARVEARKTEALPLWPLVVLVVGLGLLALI